jgi:hypothetical protein
MQQTIKDRAFLVIRYGKPSPPLGRKTCMIGTRLFSPGGLGGLEILLWMTVRASENKTRHIDPCLLGLTVLCDNARY